MTVSIYEFYFVHILIFFMVIKLACAFYGNIKKVQMKCKKKKLSIISHINYSCFIMLC